MARLTRPRLNQVTLHQFHELLGDRPDTIKRRLFEPPPVPMAMRGKQALFPARAALERLLLGRREAINPAQERARRDRADAMLKELALRERTEELIPRVECARALSALATTVSSRLQSLPSMLAREVASETRPAVCEARLREAIHQALNDLANRGAQAMAELAAEEAAAEQS